MRGGVEDSLVLLIQSLWLEHLYRLLRQTIPHPARLPTPANEFAGDPGCAGRGWATRSCGRFQSTFPQRLKPRFTYVSYGRAEARPFQSFSSVLIKRCCKEGVLSFAAANDTPPCPASHPSKRVCWGPRLRRSRVGHPGCGSSQAFGFGGMGCELF